MNINKMRTKGFKKHTAVSAAILVSMLLSICGCGKKAVMRADYIIPVTIKATAESKAEPYGNIKAYAFYRDTTNFKPVSYEQALSGRMTDLSTDAIVMSDVTGEYDTNYEAVVFPNIVSTPVTLVICDVENELYAYSEKKLVAGLPQVTIPLLFEPYRFTKNGTVIESNAWRIKSSPRPEEEPEPEPDEQQ